ncbi:MAG: hypothetical protein GXO79_07345 [Chlorobi bacterium]|nr:hypothetical protein [Chlorobiota bacterium]
MKKLIIKFSIYLLISTLPILGYSQCKSFTKQVCMPKLDPYIYNGQLNSAILNEGDIAELVLTFYGGQDYRIAVCSEEEIGNVQFKLLDTDRNPIFDNAEQEYADYWDFKCNSTQQIIVEVTVPESDGVDSSIKNGCVSILVGFLSK